jgi:phage gpG-like protein
MGKAIGGMRRTLGLSQALGVVAQKDIIDHFRNEQGPDGRWKALKPSTLAQRTKKGSKFGKILSDTGRLRDISFEATNDKVTVGTSVDYGVYHQKGIGVPQREWAYISDRGEKQIVATIEGFIGQIFDFKRL